METPDRFARLMALLQQHKLINVPVFCDAVAIRGKATASGKDVYFGRAFQLVTGWACALQ